MKRASNVTNNSALDRRSFLGAALRTYAIRPQLLEELEKRGSIKIVGAMYNLTTGVVEFVG